MILAQPDGLHFVIAKVVKGEHSQINGSILPRGKSGMSPLRGSDRSRTGNDYRARRRPIIVRIIGTVPDKLQSI